MIMCALHELGVEPSSHVWRPSELTIRPQQQMASHPYFSQVYLGYFSIVHVSGALLFPARLSRNCHYSMSSSFSRPKARNQRQTHTSGLALLDRSQPPHTAEEDFISCPCHFYQPFGGQKFRHSLRRPLSTLNI